MQADVAQQAAAATVRPARSGDLPQLLQLAARTGVGLTTLPQNHDLLAERIAESQASLASEVASAGSESYLFVLEAGGRVVACSAIIAAVGMDQPFYNYHVGRTVFASRELGVYRSVPTLYLSNDLTGSSELATLFVDPAFRGTGVSRLISLCRFLFMAAHPQRFAERVIAELRGYADADGESPFWESLGRHFFAMDFSRADRLSGARTRAFIAELMPRHPLYTVLLPRAAQEVIADVHPETRPARRILEREGFRYRDYVDIFDAGPVVEADREDIRSIRETRAALLYRVADESAATQPALVGNASAQDFRAVSTQLQVDGDRVSLSAAAAARLGLAVGDSLHYRLLPPSRH